MQRILIIEDDALMQNMYTTILNSAGGYEVVCSADGVDGIERAKTFKPALILLDVMLPKMNGFEVLEKLKKDPETKDIPVIVNTALDNSRDAEKVVAMGASGYLLKSQNNPDEFLAIVKKTISSAE